MLRYAAIFLVIAILFWTLGFGGIIVGAEASFASTVTNVSKILFFVFMTAAIAWLRELQDIPV